MGHRSGFATPLYLRGFTPILQRELQLPGLLAHGLLEIHGRHTLLSVRPFVRRSWVQAHDAFVGLLWPLLTSRSAGRPNSAMPASPFQASGETSPGKNDDLPRTIAGSTPLPLGRRSFAVSGPLAPVRSASYPVPVRRLTGSFHASFSVRLTTNALRFPSVPATQVPGGLSPPSHRPCRAHHTSKRGDPALAGPPLSFLRDGEAVLRILRATYYQQTGQLQVKPRRRPCCPCPSLRRQR